MPLNSKLKKIQGLFKALHKNLRTFQGLPLKFKDFSRLCEPCVIFFLKTCEQNEHMHLQQGRKKQAALRCIQEP